MPPTNTTGACRAGDTVELWHIAGPSVSGTASLPAALAVALKARGVGEVEYRPLYATPGSSQAAEVADAVRHVNAAHVCIGQTCCRA